MEAYKALAKLVGGPPTLLDLAACLEEHAESPEGAWIHTSAEALGIRGVVSLTESMTPCLVPWVRAHLAGADESAGWSSGERALAGILANLIQQASRDGVELRHA